MANSFSLFERIVRKANEFSEARATTTSAIHPFEERNIHPKLASVARKLFDDGHYAQATFEVYKYLDNAVKSFSNIDEAGFKLMMSAFRDDTPPIRLNNLASQTEKDEQKGYQFIFSGAMLAIRNPRGHENLNDPISLCLDHLAFASHLLRRLDSAGYK
ncbi:MAG: TIGR02391 family protein [Anaerolineales bacterium]|nr:TIGR02391 family protein [Anaerolineales bacterium]